MKYHEFLKLPFPDTVLAAYLHLSLSTIKKLREDWPVSHQTILDVGNRLMKRDSDIITALEQINSVKRQPPFTLDPRQLVGVPNASPLPSDSNHHFAISSILGGPHRLIVAVVHDTPQIQKRLGHSLYADQWLKYPTCPIAELSPTILRQLMRSIFNLSQPNLVVIDTNYHHHRMLVYALVILLAIKSIPDHESVSFQYDLHAAKIGFDLHKFWALLEQVQRFAFQTRAVRINFRSVAANQSLGIQASQLVTHAALTIPAEQLSRNHINLMALDTLRKDAYLANFIDSQNHRR